MAVSYYLLKKSIDCLPSGQHMADRKGNSQNHEKLEHISSNLTSLHWSPVAFRIELSFYGLLFR